jgi:hypothetical protein
LNSYYEHILASKEPVNDHEELGNVKPAQSVLIFPHGELELCEAPQELRLFHLFIFQNFQVIGDRLRPVVLSDSFKFCVILFYRYWLHIEFLINKTFFSDLHVPELRLSITNPTKFIQKQKLSSSPIRRQIKTLHQNIIEANNSHID